MFNGVSRLIANHLTLLLHKHTRSEGPSLHRHYPASPVHLTLSDSRSGHYPSGSVGVAISTGSGSPPITQTTFLTCHAHYPGGSEQVLVGFFPARTAFPQSQRGRHPRLHFRGLLKLHSRCGLPDCSPAQWPALSQGSDPASRPTEPPVSYHVLPTTTCVSPPLTGDLRRWGALRNAAQVQIRIRQNSAIHGEVQAESAHAS